MKKLPIGISGLAEIITGDYLYIDKTPHVYNLVNRGKYYFLSRPRRFGKSLLIDTIKQAFLGRKDLFKGLYLENNWDWNVTYPVLHFTFGEGNAASANELDAKITKFLDAYYESYQIQNIYDEISSRFAYLIEQLASTHDKVVILVDEYDKPILDNIDNTEIAKAMRGRLRNFYSVIKSQDVNVKFAMLTGVSRFSKISIFSELNNLKDITLDKRYADICGYNQSELEHSFSAYLAEGQVDLKQLKKWYNGYNFAGSEQQKVYNPFDILLFIDGDYQYQSYWFETATPTFLVKMIEKSRYFIPDLEDIVVGEDLLRTFDIDNMPIETLLFQTGYLTIKGVTTIGTQYAFVLTYPNLEVKASLNGALATIASNQMVKNQHLRLIAQSLQDDDFQRLQTTLSSHFASIPNDWYRNNQIDQYEGSSQENEEHCSSLSDARSTERRAGIRASQDALGEGFYASIVYSFITALGYDTIPEDVTNHGKIDLTIIMRDKIVIVEFKLAKLGDAQSAIQQIKDKKYAEKYLGSNKPIYLIGISFDSTDRNVVDLLSERFSA